MVFFYLVATGWISVVSFNQSIRSISETETLRVRNVVDATRCFFVFFGVHGCEPGRVSDGSRPALCQTLSIECRSLIFL